MAVSQATTGNSFSTSATLSSWGLTIVGWWKINGTGGSASSILGIGSGANTLALQVANNGLVSLVTASTSGQVGEDITINGGWYWGGIKVDGAGNAQGFISAIGPGNQAGVILYGAVTTVGSFTAPVLFLTDISGNWADAAIENVSVWTSALNDAQLQAIMPIRKASAGAWAYWPLLTASDETDHSGNGRNLTAAGSNSTVSGPTITTSSPSARALKIVPYGNSIVAGFNGSVDVPAQNWPTQLASILSTLRPTATVITNQGYDGHTTIDLTALIAANIQPLYDATKSCVVMYQEGTNDIFKLGGTYPDDATTTLNRFLLMTINLHALGFYVILNNVLLTNNAVHANDAANFAQFCTLLSTSPSVGADWYIDIRNDSYFSNPGDTSVFVDGLHPTPAGYIHLANDESAGLTAWLLSSGSTSNTSPAIPVILGGGFK